MTIAHRFGTYEIAFETLSAVGEAVGDRRAFVITDRNVESHWRQSLPKAWPTLSVEPGELSKSPDVYVAALEWLASVGADRRSVIVALGGGVVGDLAGFVAATYMRGIDYIQAPTTLLAQVDSSVGGKVAIDLAAGKNLAGAFYPPIRVSIDLETLGTLPARHIRNGMAEVLKYGFIEDPDLLKVSAQVDEATIRKCLEIKARIVEADEFETTGERAKLNFGHTIGHAIEKVLGYQELLHGEAIAIGMVVETRIAESMGLAKRGLAKEVEAILSRHELPVSHPVLSNAEALIGAMMRDKKAVGSQIAMSLVAEFGQCKLIPSISRGVMEDALRLSA
jgi:3-dehydroquinate synthase